MKKTLTILIITVLVISCGPKERGPSILEGQLCGELCWNNIYIGMTDEKEFLSIVSNLQNVKQETIASFNSVDNTVFDSVISFQFLRILGDKNTLVNISALTKKNKIVFMTFQGDLGLSFQAVIDAFSEPTLVSPFWGFDDGINIHFINNVEGVDIFIALSSEKSSISPNTEVNYLSLFDTDLYQTFLETNLFNPDYNNFILYNWEGYGEIQDHYWPPQ